MLAQIHRVKLAVFVLFLLTGLFLTSALAQMSISREKMKAEIAVEKPLEALTTITATAAMHATSADIDLSGNTYIVLYWKPEEKVIGYNLYRREKTATTFSKMPINGTKPIASVKTCSELKAIIPEGSAEWDMLESAFSSLAIKEKTKAQRKVSLMDMKDSKILADTSLVEKKTDMVLMADKLAATSSTSDKIMIKKDAGIFASSVGIGMLRPDLILSATNPCTVIQRGLTAEEAAIFDMLASANLKIRLARGLGYIDHNVVANKRYIYELRGVKTDGKEVVIAQNIEVWAGHYTLPSPPSAFSSTAGDRKVLCTWNRNPYAFSYMMKRSTSPSGSYQYVNTEPVVYNITKDLEGNDINPPDGKPGLVDYQRWSDDGLPISHDVETSGGTVSVAGPENYVTYYYKVVSRDILDREGTWSNYQSAMPIDQTPPKAPGDFKVDPSSAPVGLALSWRKVTRDINNHQELDTTQIYNIYRADTLDALDNVTALIPASSLFVHSLTANPTDTATMTITWTDTDPILVPAYGEKDFYYRLKCVDANSNVGSPSAAISGRAPDTTSPGSTSVTGSEGYADNITIMWDPNTEPDLAGYQIWRSVCDKGKPYQPGLGEDYEDDKQQQRIKCDFFLVGEILLKEAKKRLAETGNIYYEDYSVPEGSPICYAYWVRAFDMARNLYPGKWYNECPDTGEYICQRLYEETPPPVPIISGLKAKNDSVLVEWISSSGQ